jgi:hypothetical protein
MPRKRKAAPSEIFISHSSKNASFVNRLKEVLAAHGLTSFLSKTSIRGAQEWHDEIGTALRRCDWFLLVLSPQAVTSAWVKHELIYALQKNRYRGRIVPIVYRMCDKDALSWTLSAIEWIDFPKAFDEGCRQLLSIWRVKYRAS